MKLLRKIFEMEDAIILVPILSFGVGAVIGLTAAAIHFVAK